MKISCTVSEFGQIVRRCERCMNCETCPLYPICVESEGKIEKFIRADQITDDVERVGE